MKTKLRTFPIMSGDCLRFIPWSMIEAHEKQAHRNHSQTLNRLAQRGGLSPCEAMAVIMDRQWRADDYAEAQLSVLVGRELARLLREATAPAPQPIERLEDGAREGMEE